MQIKILYFSLLHSSLGSPTSWTTLSYPAFHLSHSHGSVSGVVAWLFALVYLCACVRYIKIQRKTFAVSHHGKSGGLTLDWQTGFALAEGADSAIVWQYKFSQLRGSSDDGKSKLKLHFQDHETRAIETKVSNHTRIRKF